MEVLRTETLPIRSSPDLTLVRQKVRLWSLELKFSAVDQTKIVTAASELARNTLVHGRGGQVILQLLREGVRFGLRLSFEDKGPGIPDIQLAMRDGYTTVNSLGLGLGGARRLVNEFEISSKVGEGTRVRVTKWK